MTYFTEKKVQLFVKKSWINLNYQPRKKCTSWKFGSCVNRPDSQWDTARQISLIFVRDISKSVGCVIIRFLRYYRLTDDNHKPTMDDYKLMLRPWSFKNRVSKCQCQSYPPNSVVPNKVQTMATTNHCCSKEPNIGWAQI